MLTRLLRYADKRFDVSGLADDVGDDCKSPEHKAGVVVRSLLLMLVVRLGSLNALERPGAGRLSRWIGGKLPSADALGRAACGLHADDVRGMVHRSYSKMRRGKNISALYGHRVLVLDGHEFYCSNLRSCPDCQKRTITTKRGEHTQYYHRCVVAMLVHGKGRLLLDVELQQPGEDEIAAAMRLLLRLLHTSLDAFDVISGDALYLNLPPDRRVRPPAVVPLLGPHHRLA